MSNAPEKDFGSVVRPSVIKCWQIVQHILHRWSVLVPFHISPGHAGFKSVNSPEEDRPVMNEVVMFFVPKDASNRFEIVQFLDRELDPIRREEGPAHKTETEETTMFGVEARIYPMVFESPMLDPYLTDSQRRRVQRETFKQMHDRLKKQGVYETEPQSPKDKLMRRIFEVMADEGGEPPEVNEEDDRHGFYGISPEDIAAQLPDWMKKDLEENDE